MKRMSEENRGLTAPHRDVFTLRFHHDRSHGHGDRNGVEVGRVWAEGEDGCFGGQSLSALNSDPVETSGEPHDPHDGPEHHVHQPAEEPAHPPSDRAQPWPHLITAF